ncbi:MAG: hypothetical protein H0V79_07795 [Actinobacteria bacterium]|nr:hypothetical protein [Actinomycetota bacterium]
MPFMQLANAQEVEVVVDGPGDVNRLYLCKGLAQGSTSVNVQPGQGDTVTDTWQFHIGPQLDANKFRRAIAIMSFAGLQEQDPGAAWISYYLQMFGADFDDDNGKVKVSVTNSLSMSNSTPTAWASSAITQLAYDITILAAV